MKTFGNKCALIVRAAILLLVPAAAYAQGCSMCATTAAAARQAAIQALRNGILILLFPVLTLFIAIFAVAYRNRDRFNEPLSEENPPPEETQVAPPALRDPSSVARRPGESAWL